MTRSPPSEDASIESLPELIQQAVDERAEQINVAFPAQVLTYDPATQRANLRPAVQRPVKDEDGAPQAEVLADLFAVPVSFPRAGGMVFHMPLQTGDFLLVLCATWSLSEWRRQGGTGVDPGDNRHHHLANAVALAGVFPASQAVSGLDAVTMLLGTPGGVALKITPAVMDLGTDGGPYHPAARASDAVQVTLTKAQVATIASPSGACSTPSDIVLTGTITAGSSKVNISD